MLLMLYLYLLYVVGCQDMVRLGDLVLGYPCEVPLRLMLINLLFSLKDPIKLKIIKSLRMRRSLVKLSGLVKAVTKMVTGCKRMM